MLKDVIRLIKESGLLNASWYEVQYPDVKILGMDPIEHYLRYGEQLGRRPSPDFDPQAYLSAYPDVKKFGNSVLLHFIKHGVSEGRKAGLSKGAIDSIFGSSCSPIKTERENQGSNISKPAAFDDKRIAAEIKFIKESKFFDERYYKENNRDVVFNKVDCIEHYVKWGAFEGRNPTLCSIQPFMSRVTPKYWNPASILWYTTLSLLSGTIETKFQCPFSRQKLLRTSLQK